MPVLSPQRQSVPVLPGLQLLGRGKVRDSYQLPDGNLLIVATNGISIFDFVLNALVPQKGAVLTAMSHYWLGRIEKELGIKTHMLATGAAVDECLPVTLRGNPELQSQAMVVRKLAMADVEFVVRGYLTGSGLKSYKEDGMVCGIKLPPGLQDGDELPEPIFSPTTKSQEGHDIPLDAAVVQKQYPEETALALKIYTFAAKEARHRGIIIADTKFEFGRDDAGNVVLGDEALTADSSRFWPAAVWAAGRKLGTRKAPPPFDKQLVREWGIELGINKLEAEKPEDIAHVQSLDVPQKLIGATAQTFRYILWRKFGMKLETYQRDVLGIAVEEKQRRVAMVFGSKSDIARVPRAKALLQGLQNGSSLPGIAGKPQVHVLSCHRNPSELLAYAASGYRGADVIIAAGSKAFALPGIIDAVVNQHDKQKKVPVIGVALGDRGSLALAAAKLSISELPGQPVVMDEMNDRVYVGDDGLCAALERAARGEFPAPKKRIEKPAEFDIDLSAIT